jgi:hypothetical protein
MAKMLVLSRAAFYDHVGKGHFLAPVYAVRSRRPIFTADMQRQNLEVRATQVGVNGDFVLFYERQPRAAGAALCPRTQTRTSSLAATLRERLTALGLEGLSEAKVEQALDVCFPQGCNGTPEADVLRVIFRHLRRPDPAR